MLVPVGMLTAIAWQTPRVIPVPHSSSQFRKCVLPTVEIQYSFRAWLLFRRAPEKIVRSFWYR